MLDGLRTLLYMVEGGTEYVDIFYRQMRLLSETNRKN